MIDRTSSGWSRSKSRVKVDVWELATFLTVSLRYLVPYDNASKDVSWPSGKHLLIVLALGSTGIRRKRPNIVVGYRLTAPAHNKNYEWKYVKSKTLFPTRMIGVPQKFPPSIIHKNPAQIRLVDHQYWHQHNTVTHACAISNLELLADVDERMNFSCQLIVSNLYVTLFICAKTVASRALCWQPPGTRETTSHLLASWLAHLRGRMKNGQIIWREGITAG